MPNKTAKETVKAFKETFAFYGNVYPYSLQTDSGKTLTSYHCCGTNFLFFLGSEFKAKETEEVK